MTRTKYILLCAFACICPLALIAIRLILDGSATFTLKEQLALAFISSVVASLFTYPTGLIGTAVLVGTIHFKLLTPLDAILFAAPFYICAGYMQWYVLIPNHFRRLR